MRPEEELYLVGQDRECLKNLAAMPEHQVMKQHLRLQMEQLLKAEGDPRMLGQETFFDTIEYVGNKSHGWDAWIKHAQSPVKTPE